MKRTILLFIAIIITTQLFSRIFRFMHGTKFYLEEPEMNLRIDSAIIKNNVFVLTGRLKDAPQGIFLSTTSEGHYYWCYLFIGNEKVTLQGDKKNFPFYLQINGSIAQDMNNQLNEKTRSLMTDRNALTDNLGPLLTDGSDSAKAQLRLVGKQLQYIDRLTDSIKLKFIQTHLNSYAALNELYFLKTKFNKDSLKQLYISLKDEFRKSIYGNRILNYIKVGETLKVGDRFADFEAEDQYGKLNSFSTYHGKYVLLDFTETYCGPCIFSVEELKEIAKKYSDSLMIISFCADKSRAIWKKGLERDRISWPSLWDGAGTESKTVLKYGINGYPSFFLINPQGKIISKWSGYGKGNLIERISKHVPGNGKGG